ncbi:MAG: hypothetical protein KGL01_00645, partial [Betaproteobacteria bacterium]|nr:hypothetical protein [Betaproteobacteria bacterium]
MKKVILSLAGALAATAFAPEASAIPAFARQMGVACQACHFQHFPELNSFGRAFKNSGFTLIGAQPKIEGEHLSIPATLNMSILATAGYENVSNSGTVATALTPATTNGKFFVPNSGGELSLFVAGRISENFGFLTELAGTIGTSPFKLPMLWEVGGGNTRVGLVAVGNNFPAYSFETLNTGAASTHRLMGNAGPASGTVLKTHIAVTGAAQYLGTSDMKGNGVSFVANGDMGFVNLGKYDLTAVFAPSNTNAMSTTYARGAYIFNAGGWDSAIGIQSFTGSAGAPLLATAAVDTKATIIDGQMQGEAGGMPLGLYASYGRAPASASGNAYNGGALNTTVLNRTASDRKSFNIAGELGVIPNKATLQLAYRSANDGSGSANAALAAGGRGDRDNALMLGATYELAQNVGLYLTYTTQSGSAWNTCTAVIGACAAVGSAPIGKTV